MNNAEIVHKLSAVFAEAKIGEAEASIAMATLIGIICANVSQDDYQTGLKHLSDLSLATAGEIAKAIIEKRLVLKPKPATAYTIPINSDGEVDDVVAHTTDDNRVEYRDGKFVIGVSKTQS